MNELTRIYSSIAIAAALIASACTPPRQSASSGKSVDNFARGAGASVRRNVCGNEASTVNGKIVIDRRYENSIYPKNGPLTDDVLKTLAAVPENIKGPFFRIGGRIEVRSDTLALCSRIGLSAADKKFAGENTGVIENCWQQQKSGQAPVIYLSSDAAAIRHGLLRIFAYVHLEFFIARLEQLDSQGDGKKTETKALHTAMKRYTAQRVRIGRALLEDAKRVNPSGAIALDTMRKQSAGRFDNIAVAEAIDSYYCSIESNRIFESVFFKSHAAFTRSTESVPALAKELGPPIGFTAE